MKDKQVQSQHIWKDKCCLKEKIVIVCKTATDVCTVRNDDPSDPRGEVEELGANLS